MNDNIPKILVGVTVAGLMTGALILGDEMKDIKPNAHITVPVFDTFTGNLHSTQYAQIEIDRWIVLDKEGNMMTVTEQPRGTRVNVVGQKELATYKNDSRQEMTKEEFNIRIR